MAGKRITELTDYSSGAFAVTNEIEMSVDTGGSVFVSRKVSWTDIIANMVNFANTDLTFTGNRAHDTNGLNFELTTDAGVYGASWLYINHSSGVGIGFNSYSFDAGSSSAGITANGSTVINCFATGAVVNDAGADYDFRVEGDTDTNLLFTDASVDFVGVGSNSPQAKLDIHAQGSLSSDPVLNVRNSADTADLFTINGDGSFVGLPFEQIYAVSDEVFDLVTGTAKLTFRMPHAVTLTDVRASVSTAPTGSTIIVDINQNAVSILSTKLTIDATEKTSTTATTPPVISTSALTDDAEITIDIDQVGSTIAGVGLKVTFIGARA